MGIKILMISEYFPPYGKGGGEQSAFLLAKSLAEQGNDVTVLTAGFNKKDDDNLHESHGSNESHGLKEQAIGKNFRVIRTLKTGISPGSLLSNIKRALIFHLSVKKEIKRILKREDFDIIHYLNTNSISGMINTKIPQVAHVNSPVFFCPKGTLLYKDSSYCTYYCTEKRFKECFLKSREFGKLQNKWYFMHNPLLRHFIYRSYIKRKVCLKKMDRLIAVSGFMKERLKMIGISDNKISILPNIMDKDSSKNDNSENNRNDNKNDNKKEGFDEVHTGEGYERNHDQNNRDKRSAKEVRLLYLGQYLSNKGVFVLLNALRLLKIPYSCSFYGNSNGSVKEAMESYIRKYKLNAELNDNVKHEDVHQLYDNNDILIFPSLIPESFGRVAIEAMSHGIPVIGSAIGGIKNIIRDKVNGLLVKPGDEKALAEAISTLAKAGSLRKRLVKEGRKEAQRYQGKKIAKEAIRIYEQAILDKLDKD